MPEWSILQWLDAGTAPLIALVFAILWRLERRILKIEIAMKLEPEREAKA